MTLSPINELRLFFICLLCGGSLGLLFDLFRIPRRLYQVGYGWTFFQDILYFLTAGGLTVYTLFHANAGVLRGFELFALLLGVFLYLFCLSRLLLPLLIKVASLLIWLVKKILFFTLFPLHICAKPVIIISVSLRQLLRRFRRRMSGFKARLARILLFMKKM
ncbi:MAG: spore cortex biosynthesis protein YabQ [Clostridia bacterium]|nr:spore cortex biosynthesis protein YabQ [Clostridia bacterium]